MKSIIKYLFRGPKFEVEMGAQSYMSIYSNFERRDQIF